ncbi:MAG: FHA domain-containing protein [Firmicutes bacterium]|jgi:hypothetical protein|nr:FHA domain-containing protein [Bacillota bacterium]MDH7496500.1 DUF3662 and FHA domain-containing protein [Bacillota bacterium]
MSFLTRVERAIEEVVEGIFRRARDATHPVEIGRYLVREMEDEKRISVSRTYVPNRYRVKLHARDVDYLGPLARTLSRELSGHVIARARRQGYSFVGRVDVEFEADEDAKPGDIRVDGLFVEDDEAGGEEDGGSTRRCPVLGEVHDYGSARADLKLAAQLPDGSGAPVARQDSPGHLERGQPGFAHLALMYGTSRERVVPLSGERMIVGRSSSCHIVIEDAGVSRRHAEIGLESGRFYVADLGSTNGTYVNGRKVSRHLLADGDVVSFGKVAARFREA